MRRVIAIIGAMGLLAGSGLTAKADGLPAADFGPIPTCALIAGGTGTYTGGVLLWTMDLEGSALCDGEEAIASYDLYVIKDKPSGALPTPADAHSFDVGSLTQPQLVSSDPTVGVGDRGQATLSYRATISDDDPTVCVFSVVHGTVPVTTTTTTTTTDEGDHNGNGTTADDKHRTNDGDNSDGDKHEWDETTTTTTTTTHEPYANRAPWALSSEGEEPAEDPYACHWINAISEAYYTADPGSPSRGYN